MKFRSFFIVSAFFLIHAVSNPAAADRVQAKQILVLPPAVHSSEDMGFLKKGIIDMLASRLAGHGEAEVLTLDQQEVDKQGQAPDWAAAAALGRQMGADYVILISLTVIGDSASTDAQVIEVANEKTVMTFGQAGREQADVISHIDQFAAQVNSQLLGTGAPRKTAQTDSLQKQKPAGEPKTTPGIYQHPEKLLNQPALEQERQSWGSEMGRAASAELLMRGPRWDAQISGVTTGDVDGDGDPELVCIDSQTIFVYRIEKGKFIKIAETNGGINNVRVDAADVNGNGKDEIFITNFDNKSSRVGSFAMEWNGSSLERSAEQMTWFLRTVDWPGRGKIIAGQRQGFDTLFAPGIYEIIWQNGQYETAERLALPRNLDIYGFAYGPVRSHADNDIVAFDSGGYIRILDQRGEEQWASTERYGGSANFFQVPDWEDPKESIKRYLSPHIHLFDVNNDGVQEILVMKNLDSASAFAHIRLFKNGRLEALKWDQLGLTPFWKTRDLSKYISDFTLCDIDGDTRPEAIAVIVSKTKHALSKGSSFVVVFKLFSSETAVQP